MLHTGSSFGGFPVISLLFMSDLIHWSYLINLTLISKFTSSCVLHGGNDNKVNLMIFKHVELLYVCQQLSPTFIVFKRNNKDKPKHMLRNTQL